MERLGDLAAEIVARAADRPRLLVAIAGPPAAGKSKVARALLARLEALRPGAAAIVPMDGYHYDNAVLDELGLRARKGAPQTFDAAGFARDLERIRAGEDPVAVPVFDRGLDLARAGARLIRTRHRIVLVEGNYLLLDEPPWDRLGAMFDLSVFLDVHHEELRRRLVARWLRYGLDPEAAAARAETNDLPNATLILARSRAADVRLPNISPEGARIG